MYVNELVGGLWHTVDRAGDAPTEKREENMIS